MIITIFIYLVFVIPLGIKNYLRNQNIPNIVKVINLVITFLIFQYYFGDFRHMLWDIFKTGITSLYSTQEYVYFTREFDFLTSIIYFLGSLYSAGLALNIAAKAKSQRLFLYSSPILVIVTSIDFAKSLVSDYGLEGNFLYSILLSIVILSLFFGLINIFYFVNPGKKLFIHS